MEKPRSEYGTTINQTHRGFGWVAVLLLMLGLSPEMLASRYSLLAGQSIVLWARHDLPANSRILTDRTGEIEMPTRERYLATEGGESWAWHSTDLLSGASEIRAESAIPGFDMYGGLLSTDSLANAQMWDHLVISGPFAGAPVMVKVRVRYTGRISSGVQPETHPSFYFAVVGVEGAGRGGEYLEGPQTPYHQIERWVGDKEEIDETFVRTYAYSEEQPVIFLYTISEVDTFLGGKGHLRTEVSIEVPPGFTFTSAGGFLRNTVPLVPSDDVVMTGRDTPVTINVMANDANPSGGGMLLGEVTAPRNGTLTRNANGTVRYTPNTGFTGTDEFHYTLSSRAMYLPSTGHYYEYIPSHGIHWMAAEQGARGRTLHGLQGYLVTITSPEENQFVSNVLNGSGWLGASDAEQEGDWKWVTGPEAGQRFWSGGGTDVGGGPVEGRYSNWNGTWEPNDYPDSGIPHQEDYAMMFASSVLGPTDSWNDGKPHEEPDNPYALPGYTVEYGGMPGDNSQFVFAKVTVQVEYANHAPVATATGPLWTHEGAGVWVNLEGNDVDNDPLTFEVVAGPSHGELRGTAPYFIYIPTAEFSGEDSVTYLVSDGQLSSEPATIRIEVSPVGTVLAWGENDRGQLGRGTFSAMENLPGSAAPFVPEGPAIAISAGLRFTAAVDARGSLWAWGHGEDGQLGNFMGNSATPVKLMSWLQATTVDGIRINEGPKVQVAAGGYHGLLLVGGEVYSWGFNSAGQRGLGSGAWPADPQAVSFPDGVRPMAIAVGQYNSYALGSDGSVWAWGSNFEGQLGDASAAFVRDVPGRVTLPGGRAGVAIGAGAYHCLVLAEDGTLWSWGMNNYGQLGDSTTTSRSTPVQVGIPAGRTVRQIAGGMYHSLALMADGTIWSWGNNQSGQLGRGFAFSSATPDQVRSMPGNLRVTAISAGQNSSLALLENGQMAGWGSNSQGQLGMGSATPGGFPALVLLPEGAEAFHIGAGYMHAAAIATLPAPPAPAPVITAASPQYFLQNGLGRTMEISGSGFVAGAVADWNDETLSTVSVEATRMVVKVSPARLGTMEDLTAVVLRVQNPDGQISNPFPLAVTAPEIGAARVEIISQGIAQPMAVHSSEIQAGIEVEMLHRSETLMLSLAGIYSAAPEVAGTLATGNARFIGLEVTGAGATDSALVEMFYPAAATGVEESNLRLRYWNGAAWAMVKSAGGMLAGKNVTDVSGYGGQFTVLLDASSEPAIGELDSVIFGIFAAAPVLGELSVSPTEVSVGATIQVTLPVSFPIAGQQGEATIDWGEGTVATVPVVNGLAVASKTYDAAGNFTVGASVMTLDGEVAQANPVAVRVIQPSNGFVTGGGWLTGTGKEKWHFNINIKANGAKGGPSGKFTFNRGGLDLAAESFDWLTVSASRGEFKGRGVMNANQQCTFRAVIEPAQNRPHTAAKLWLRVYDESGGVLFDNGRAEVLGGGNITLHVK